MKNPNDAIRRALKSRAKQASKAQKAIDEEKLQVVLADKALGRKKNIEDEVIGEMNRVPSRKELAQKQHTDAVERLVDAIVKHNSGTPTISFKPKGEKTPLSARSLDFANAATPAPTPAASVMSPRPRRKWTPIGVSTSPQMRFEGDEDPIVWKAHGNLKKSDVELWDKIAQANAGRTYNEVKKLFVAAKVQELREKRQKDRLGV